METFINSYDMRVWRAIKCGDIPIPLPKRDSKNDNGEVSTVVVSTLKNYSDEKMLVI